MLIVCLNELMLRKPLFKSPAFFGYPYPFQTPEVNFGKEHTFTENFYINDQFLLRNGEAKKQLLLTILGKIYWLLCRNSTATHPIIKFSIYTFYKACLFFFQNLSLCMLKRYVYKKSNV